MDSFDIYSMLGDVKISYLEFAMSLQGWDTRPIMRDSELIAVLKFKGPEFHFHSTGRHNFTRQEIREEVFEPLWKRYGYARTKTPVSDTRQQRFNERIGFRKIGENEHEIHYQIDKP